MSEGIGIFPMKHIQRPECLSVGDHTSSSQVGTSSRHTQVPNVKLDEIGPFASLKINLNSESITR